MNKALLPLIICVQLASAYAAATDLPEKTTEEKYITELTAIVPEIGLMVSDISSVRKHNCNETLTIKRMQEIIANDEFVTDTLRKYSKDHSYMKSDEYRNTLDQTYKKCS